MEMYESIPNEINLDASELSDRPSESRRISASSSHHTSNAASDSIGKCHLQQYKLNIEMFSFAGSVFNFKLSPEIFVNSTKDFGTSIIEM
jgi:hypothetical protein